MNGINFVSPRSWLSTSYFGLGFFLFVGYLWHAGRARVTVAGNEWGINRSNEAVLSLKSQEQDGPDTEDSVANTVIATTLD